MKKTAALFLILFFSSCSTWNKLDNQEKGTVIGGGTGAVVGSSVGGSVGTVIGGAAGAVGGNIIGNEMDKKARRRP